MAASPAFDRNGLDKSLKKQEKISYIDEPDGFAIAPLVNVTKT
jgi:hypothetical protein